MTEEAKQQLLKIRQWLREDAPKVYGAFVIRKGKKGKNQRGSI